MIADILDSPEKWCQTCIAQDKLGAPLLDVNDPRACKWCLFGAMCKAYPDLGVRIGIMQRLQAALKKLYGIYGFVFWQDRAERTFEEVRAVILEAGV